MASNFAEALAKAKEAGCDEWTGVQAYNYGLDYIQFVKERGGKHTTELAEEYSREVLSPLLGNDQNTKYRYYRWQALVYNGVTFIKMVAICSMRKLSK